MLTHKLIDISDVARKLSLYKYHKMFRSLFQCNADDKMLTILLLYLLRLSECQVPVNYVLNLDSQMECCSEESDIFVNTAGVTVGRYNESAAFMHGDLIFLQDVGSDNTMVEIVLMREVSGKYEMMFSHEICDLCSEVSKGPESDYHMYMQYFGIPEECPVLAGDYHIQEFMIDTDEFPLNSNTCGRYKVFLNMYKNPQKDCKTDKEFMLCLTMRLLIEAD